MKRSLVIFCLVLILAVIGVFNVFSESETKHTVDTRNNITVFELKAKSIELVGEHEHISLLSVERIKGSESMELGLLYVEADTGMLEFKKSAIEYERLLDSNGNELVLDDETNLTIVYDDNTGLVRYYINNKIAYYGNENLTLAYNIPIYNHFYLFEADTETVTANETFVYEVNTYNINSSGTAEIIAFQEHSSENKIRILAGVDMPWYSEVGFCVQAFEDGVSNGEKYISSNVIFESIVADGETVYATDYGFDFFAALEISEISLSVENECYIIVRPYTCVGYTKQYGRATKININQNGYIFDGTCITNTAEVDAFIVSEKVDITDNAFVLNRESCISIKANCYGYIYVEFSAAQTSELNIYVDDILVDTLNVEAGRYNIPIAIPESGSHTVKIEKSSDGHLKIYALTYFEIPHTHTVSNDAAWLMTQSGFSTVCSTCNENVTMVECQTPTFLLTFEQDVLTEASGYEGFTIVQPASYTIDTDSDGDNALAPGTNYFYIDADQSALAGMTFYSISFDLTVTKKGQAGTEISLLTLISNYRNGVKVSNTTADYAYLLKYIRNETKLSTIKINGASSKLNDENSIDIEIGKIYKITVVVNTFAQSAHIFVDGMYIGRAEKALVDVASDTIVYPSFKFNDGGNCYPLFDNFKITELK